MSLSHSVLHPVIALDAVSRSQLLTERSENHGHLVINVILEFVNPVSFPELRSAFISTFLDGNPESRFHYTIEHGFWTYVDQLDLDFHFQDFSTRAPRPISMFIDQLASEGLRFDHPPWQLVLANATTAIFRFHHALGDGATMMRQLLASVNSQPSSPLVASDGSTRFTLWEKIKAGLRLLTVFPDPPGTLRLARRPSKLNTLSHFTLLKHSVLELKNGSKLLNASINDILTCALSLALTRTLSLTKDVLATIWVSLPSTLETSDWGNERLGVSYVTLSQEYDLTRSLRTCVERLERVKNSPEPFIVNWALRSLSLMSRLPLLKRTLFPLFTDKASVSISNLKGPETRLSWPGSFAEVAKLHIVTPPIMRMGLMVNFISYAGHFSIGLCGEDSVLAEHELQRIAAAVDVAISDLISLVHSFANDVVTGRCQILDGVSATQVFLGEPAVIAFVELGSNVDVTTFKLKLISSLLTYPFNKIICNKTPLPCLINPPSDWTPEDNITSVESHEPEVLLTLLNDMSNETFDANKAQWRGVFFRDTAGDRLTFVFKYHHAYADGFTILRRFLADCDGNVVDLLPKPRKPTQTTSTLTTARNMLEAIAQIARHALPDRGPLRVQSPEGLRAVYWQELSCKVSEVKRKLNGATMNEALMQAVSNALHTTFGGDRYAATLWVSLGGVSEMGNSRLGCVLVTLRSDRGSSGQERLRDVKKEQAVIVNFVMSVVGRLPKFIGGPLWRSLASGPTVSVSNMAGPTREVKWQGELVKKLAFFVPPEANMGVFVCCVTYNDKITLALASREEVARREELKKLCEEVDREMQ